MDRADALARLKLLIGCDLVELGVKSGITIRKGDSIKLNKGWAGQACE